MDILLVLAKLWDFFFYTAAPFVLVLGIMIFVHEGGHYLAARLIGVRVLMFKLGFGKYIWSFTRGHTEYGVAWFPVGGYVKLFGDPTEVEGGEEEVALEDIPEADKAEALHFRPAPQKLLVFVTGPLMNIVLAFIIAPFIFLIGIEDIPNSKGPPIVGVVEPGSAAQKAGIVPGDKILVIGGDQINSYEQLRMKEALNLNKTLVYEIKRQGKGDIVKVPVLLKEATEFEGIGKSGIGPALMLSVVDRVIEGSAAQEAQLKPGDTIFGVNGKPISPWNEIAKAVDECDGKAIELALLRNGEKLNFSITPKFNSEHKRLMIGIHYSLQSPQMELIKYGLKDSIVEGTKMCVYYFELTLEVLWKLVSFQLSGKTVSGPFGIAAVTSRAAHSGLSDLIRLMVLISINLGILNLMPFPPLDGGHILFTSLEGIMGRQIKMKYKEAAFKAGFFLLIGLMILVTINDVIRYKSNMWGFIKEIGKGLGIG